jgi:hypothetical protein
MMLGTIRAQSREASVYTEAGSKCEAEGSEDLGNPFEHRDCKTLIPDHHGDLIAILLDDVVREFALDHLLRCRCTIEGLVFNTGANELGNT